MVNLGGDEESKIPAETAYSSEVIRLESMLAQSTTQESALYFLDRLERLAAMVEAKFGAKNE